jgi:hypothetical protein
VLTDVFVLLATISHPLLCHTKPNNKQLIEKYYLSSMSKFLRMICFRAVVLDDRLAGRLGVVLAVGGASPNNPEKLKNAN